MRASSAALARDRREHAQHRKPGMRQRIALADLGQQQRGAAVAFQIGGMRGKPRHQDQRRTVGIGRHVDQRGERVAAVAIERRQRAGAGGAQQGLGHFQRHEIRRRLGILRRAARHGAGQRWIGCCFVRRHGIPIVNATGSGPDRSRLGLEFAAESHSCCKEATIQTLILGFKTCGTSPSDAYRGAPCRQSLSSTMTAIS